MILSGMIGGMALAILILIGFCFIFLLPAIALIDLVRSDFKVQQNKIIWALIILFFPFIGSILYFMLSREQKA